MKKQDILLSIGVIFKNEIRCLERCLKSFQPLKEALPGQVEIVMADTGSDDGSREIAEKYADILFDFPWINDFAAARNAVMDRCSGQWFFTVDADEWLDEDISQLLAFMRVCDRAPGNQCTVVIRNYSTAALDWHYADFMGTRMLRMSIGVRYVGAIHEHFDIHGEQKSFNTLDKLILHHDGYICLNDGSEEGKKKSKRNLDMIEETLKYDPQNMQLMLQRLDCCNNDLPKLYEYAKQAVPGIKKHWKLWHTSGRHVIRHAVYTANMLKKPEFQEWVDLAEEVYPDSIFIRTDVQCYAAEHAWAKMDCPELIARGERYLQGLRDYRSGNFDQGELVTGIIQTVYPYIETNLRPLIARAYLYEEQPEKALETLQGLSYDTMDADQVGVLSATMSRLHSLSKVDTAPMIREFWEKISLPMPSKEIAKDRQERLIAVCAYLFAAGNREEESKRIADPSVPLSKDLSVMSEEQWELVSKLPIYRHAYTLFLPLAGKCELGTAAAILESDDPEEISKLLADMEHVQELPISALIHALECGTRFPLKEKPLNLEEMDSLAGRLVRSDKKMIQRAVDTDAAAIGNDPQALCWARGLLLAAVQNFPWTEEDADEEQGVALARSFANMERVFIPRCYASETLNENGLFMLPPMHRFGWYAAQAFELLDAGDAAGYVRLLREGLAVCEGVKDMVEFLTDHTPQLQAPKPSAELAALAEQIRTILAAYPADDPAVLALKQSEAYQRVAYLIEGIPAPVWGGLPQ